MSDVSQGPGWWQASDGKWYPPQATPGPATSPPPQPVPGQAPAPKKRGRGCLYSVVGLLALIVIIVIIAAGRWRGRQVEDRLARHRARQHQRVDHHDRGDLVGSLVQVRRDRPEIGRA